MSILCIGDIHIRFENLHLIDIVEQQIIDHIQTYSIQKVVFLGDVLHFHEKLYTQPLNRAYQLFKTLSQYAQVIVLVGNHDYINNSQFLTSNHWMNILKNKQNINIIDTTTQIGEDLFLPYVPPKRFIEAIETGGFDPTQARMIFAHQEFKGCKMGAIVSSEGDEWPEEYPQVVSGHIHDYQKPQSNIFYIGACLQHSFAETGYPKLLLIDIQSNFTEIPLQLPRKKNVYTSLEELTEEKIENIIHISNEKENECVRLVVRGDYDKFKLFKDTLNFQNLSQTTKCKIVFKPEVVQENTESNPSDSQTKNTFSDLLLTKVLETQKEMVYVVYQKIVYSTEIQPEDFIIV
jgi:DNA repair exonuclease SbcCD nuclease subunit